MASVSENVRQIDSSKCRICMFPKPNLSSLFRRGLSMKVMKLAEIKMYEGDGLPSTICLDCEVEVNRCVNFIAQIQRADAKLREMLENGSLFTEEFESDKEFEEREQEASTSQIEIEEFNVKQEMVLDNYLDEKTDANCESDHDHDHFEASIKKNQPEDEAELNPLNHVDVVEDTNRADAMDVPVDPLGQEEPLIESQKIESDPSVDPLTFMKQEAVSMDIDKNSPQPCGSSSTVESTSLSLPCQPSLKLLNKRKDSSGRKALQDNELKIKFPEQDSSTENIFRQIAGPEMVLGTYKYSASSSSQSCIGRNKIKRSWQKQRKTQEKVKSVLHSNKDLQKKELTCRIDQIQLKNELFCVICNQNFSCLETLKEHKDKNGVLCRLCTEEFKTHNDLEIHFSTHKKIRCRVCKDEFFAMKDLILHKSKMHTAKKIECTTCLRTFSTRYGLSKHVMLAHGEDEGSYDCVVCGKSYKCSFQLKQHLVHTHIVYEHLECKFCRMMYLGPYKLQSHIKKIHLDSEENTPVSCSTCGKVFNRASLLVKHLETHDNTESVCELCGKSIKTKSLMISHMQMQHSKTGTFICKICNEQFGVKKELRMHQRKHFKKRSTTVFCEICGKEYKNPQILKAHKATHADERPFKCEICGATFKLPVTLKTHRRVHSSVGKYTCNGCGTSFKWKQTFDKHLNKCGINESGSKIDFDSK